MQYHKLASYVLVIPKPLFFHASHSKFIAPASLLFRPLQRSLFHLNLSFHNFTTKNKKTL